MATIFRLGTEGAVTHQGWTAVSVYPYNTESRKCITDPNGATMRNEVTSIPSPLARVDVVKNAFAQVVASGKSIKGDTIYHKTVSNTLDVGELFFNFSKYSQSFEIIKWDATHDLDSLGDSDEKEHRLLADALRKYLATDAKTYNFDILQNIYLLNDLEGPDELNIVGATSPATLFMSTANDMSYVGNRIKFGTHAPFGRNCRPLAERDFEYVKMWFLLRKSIEGFATRFEEINDYLSLTYRAISDPAKKRELDSIGDTSGLEPIGDGTASYVEVCGSHVYQRSASMKPATSDFEIRPTRLLEGTLPLVLPVDDEGGNKYASLRYTTDVWGMRNSAPYADPLPIGERTLPNDGAKQPYLTIGDLLEATLLRVDYQWDEKSFFTGNVHPNAGSDQRPRAYLLPLTPTFFRYFTPEDIETILTMEELAAGVKVTLRIPIKGDIRTKYIEYSRRYYNSRTHGENEGRVVNMTADGTICNFQGFIMPLLHFKEEKDALFTVGCISFANLLPALEFGRKGEWLTDVARANRDPDKKDDVAAITYTITGHNFEYIGVTLRGGERSLIVPRLRQQQCNTSFRVAVDVGTSNTHVEICRDKDGASQQLTYSENVSPSTNFFKPTTIQIKGRAVRLDSDLDRFDTRRSFDYLPIRMEKDGEYSFPTPTALIVAKGLDWTAHYPPFAMANAALDYFRRPPFHEETITDIKWGGKPGDDTIFRTYVENLLLTLRNWLLVNDADIKATRLTWFYPLSMTPRRFHGMERAWNDVWHSLFNKQGDTDALTESEAPALYYYNSHASAHDIVSIDIGGGTTDIAISESRRLKLATSFRFAANDLFQNGIAATRRSGIIDFYRDLLHETFKGNESVCSQFLRSDDSPAMAATRFFALKDARVASAFTEEAKDFNRLLAADDDFKIVFIIFYAAIIYHLGLILKLTCRRMPRHIAFSGNGSKTLSVLTPSTADLALFTKKMFALQGVEGAEDGKLELLGLDGQNEPKRTTCMGALIKLEAESAVTREKMVAMRSDGSMFIGNSLTFDQVAEDSAILESVRQSVARFIHLTLDELDSTFSFNDYFGATSQSIDLAREICRADEDVLTYIERGLDICRDNADGNTELGETLFFYPIKGLLANLAERIHKEFKNVQK